MRVTVCVWVRVLSVRARTGKGQRGSGREGCVHVRARAMSCVSAVCMSRASAYMRLKQHVDDDQDESDKSFDDVPWCAGKNPPQWLPEGCTERPKKNSSSNPKTAAEDERH